MYGIPPLGAVHKVLDVFIAMQRGWLRGWEADSGTRKTSPLDEGVSVELGYAYALKKPASLFKDDWRRWQQRNLWRYGGMYVYVV